MVGHIIIKLKTSDEEKNYKNRQKAVLNNGEQR